LNVDILRMISDARKGGEGRNFKQSVELIVSLKDIDTKKGFALNEVVNLPNEPSKKAKVCVIASGDLALRARKAGADRVIEGDELNTLAGKKRETKRLSKSYDFFLADTQLMPVVGKVLGAVLGPKGKMAMPLPFNAPVDSIVSRLKSSTRVKVRNQLSVACRIGDESMSDEGLAENARTVLSAIEKKLPNGESNIAGITVKFTMGRAVRSTIKVSE